MGGRWDQAVASGGCCCLTHPPTHPATGRTSATDFLLPFLHWPALLRWQRRRRVSPLAPLWLLLNPIQPITHAFVRPPLHRATANNLEGKLAEFHEKHPEDRPAKLMNRLRSVVNGQARMPWLMLWWLLLLLLLVAAAGVAAAACRAAHLLLSPCPRQPLRRPAAVV